MRKRNNINGSGPRRHELKTFHKLGEVSKPTLRDMNLLLDLYADNDLGTDHYGISQTIDYEKTHGADIKRYRQVLLQGKELNDDAEDSRDETRYSRWLTDKFQVGNIMSDIGKHYDSVCRLRLSELVPNSQIAWHIDTDTSVMCRSQICLNEADSLFDFKDRNGVHTLKMKPGEIWFINTGWNHRVTSYSDKRRVVVWSHKFEWVKNRKDLFI